MPFSDLSRLAQEAPLRILLIGAGEALSVTVAGLVQPLRLAAKKLGPARLQVELEGAEGLADAERSHRRAAHIVLLAADVGSDAWPPALLRKMIDRCRDAQFWGGVGAPVLWLARAGAMEGVRTALPWSLYPDTDEVAERAILTPQLFELDGNRLTCCGGAASIDFSLTLVQALYGSELQADIKEALCVERIRSADDRQRVALQARFGALQPKLSEAVMLMEANIEEPLATDDIANLVGISRRQLERQFKQFLGSVPSRYYLEMRLQRARQLLRESNHSIVQVGLMCGFSSGSHFSTAYGALFGITPREERQRKLASP
jgi:AraC family transcriptional regulator, L-arginine-responsive activator